jgi:hypothetical protein
MHCDSPNGLAHLSSLLYHICSFQVLSTCTVNADEQNNQDIEKSIEGRYIGPSTVTLSRSEGSVWDTHIVTGECQNIVD